MQLCVAGTRGRQPRGEPSACQPEVKQILKQFRPLIVVRPYLSDDEPRQGHPSDGADQLHGGAVVDVSIPHCELLGLVLVVVH